MRNENHYSSCIPQRLWIFWLCLKKNSLKILTFVANTKRNAHMHSWDMWFSVLSKKYFSFSFALQMGCYFGQGKCVRSTDASFTISNELYPRLCWEYLFGEHFYHCSVPLYWKWLHRNLNQSVACFVTGLHHHH